MALAAVLARPQVSCCISAMVGGRSGGVHWRKRSEAAEDAGGGPWQYWRGMPKLRMALSCPHAGLCFLPTTTHYALDHPLDRVLWPMHSAADETSEVHHAERTVPKCWRLEARTCSPDLHRQRLSLSGLWRRVSRASNDAFPGRQYTPSERFMLNPRTRLPMILKHPWTVEVSWAQQNEPAGMHTYVETSRL